ncbi:hypothetical protein ACO0LD_24575 [Undibacterium sp. Ji83W]|uniref:hypothetical protein n=1 Tax=Undibacterium sp. Ji83W TaxID=3413043 RepID=UPI003BF15A2A
MNSLQSAELSDLVVQELAYTAPKDWRKLAYYQELLVQPGTSSRNKATARCWIGNEMVQTANRSIGASPETYDAILALHENAIKGSNE